MDLEFRETLLRDFEDASEPLTRYKSRPDGMLVSLGAELFGVKKNGRWGWVDSSRNFVIPPVYDDGRPVCADGIIILRKNGCYGGLYYDTMTQAFDFKYNQLAYIPPTGTYAAFAHSGKQALVRPGDKRITRYRYSGFRFDGVGNVEFVRESMLGTVRGAIDPVTGCELWSRSDMLETIMRPFERLLYDYE